MYWIVIIFVGSWATAGAKFLDASIDPFAGNTNFLVQVTDSLETVGSSQHVMRMADSDGTMYDCAMPQTQAQGSQNAKPSLKDAKALMQRLHSSGQCFRRSEGYWAYEVCPGSHVRQYHQEGSVVQQEFVLGQMPEDELELIVKDDSSLAQVSISEKYSRGQVCDLTGHDRTTSVHYICSHTGNAFVSIEEILSCQYLAILGTPELCKLANIKESTLHVIECALAKAEASAASLPDPESDASTAQPNMAGASAAAGAGSKEAQEGEQPAADEL